MVNYTCSRCGLDTKIRTHFRRHLYRKHTCKPLKSETSIEEIRGAFEKPLKDIFGQKKDIFGHFVDKKCPLEYTQNNLVCKYCNKAYKSEQTKNRHMKSFCREKRRQEKMAKLLRENEDLKEKILQTSSAVRTNIVNNINNTLTNNDNSINNVNNVNNVNNINTITINNYGSENLDYITQQYIQKLLDINPTQAIRILIKNIHYHPEHPENHNIKMTASNRKYNEASIWKDNKWVLRDKRTVIRDIVDKSYNILDDEFVRSIDDGKNCTSFNEFQDQYDKNDKSVHKNLGKQAELIILNESKHKKKKKPKKTIANI